MSINKVFQALASAPRRRILNYLSNTSMTAGEIAERFDMSKPSLSKHLNILEEAGLVTREKIGQYVHYSLVEESLINTVYDYVSEVCPKGKILKRESAAKSKASKGK